MYVMLNCQTTSHQQMFAAILYHDMLLAMHASNIELRWFQFISCSLENKNPIFEEIIDWVFPLKDNLSTFKFAAKIIDHRAMVSSQKSVHVPKCTLINLTVNTIICTNLSIYLLGWLRAMFSVLLSQKAV